MTTDHVRAHARLSGHSVAAAIVAATTASTTLAGGCDTFQPGDVYLISSSLPDGVGSNPGVFRYLPQSGSFGVWVPLPTGSFGPGTGTQAAGATYDPFRDRLLVPASSTVLGAIDASGALSTIPLGGLTYSLVAPGAGGIVYLVGGAHVFYLDINDAWHELLGPRSASIGLASLGLSSLSSAIYDVGTQSLIVAGPNAGSTRFARISLDVTGTQLAAPVTTTTVDLVPGMGEVVAGMSAGPAGDLYITLDINANGTFAQLQTVDPVTFDAATFATTSGFLTAALTTGTWLPASGIGVALDTIDDVIRAYPLGGFGSGTIVATGASSAGGSAEAARMVSIGTTINGSVTGDPAGGDLDGDGHVGAADLGILLGAWGPCTACVPCPADLDGDLDVAASDLAILLGSWG